MIYKIIGFAVFTMLIYISYICLHEKDSSCMKPVETKDLSFIYLRTNETNTKALLSFCLLDDSEQFVTVQIERSDSGNIHIYIWPGEDVYRDMDQKMYMLIPKSPIPGLTQSIVKEGKVVEDKALINGFSVEFETNPSPLKNYVIIAKKRISLKDRGSIIYCNSDPSRIITSWPINLN